VLLHVNVPIMNHWHAWTCMHWQQSLGSQCARVPGPSPQKNYYHQVLAVPVLLSRRVRMALQLSRHSYGPQVGYSSRGCEILTERIASQPRRAEAKAQQQQQQQQPGLLTMPMQGRPVNTISHPRLDMMSQNEILASCASFEPSLHQDSDAPNLAFSR
jgi:hypothetical protein